MALILDDHMKLLKLVAKGEATKHIGDGYHDGWVRISHSNIVKAMGGRGGWPPLLNLAKDLAENKLIEANDDTFKTIHLTEAGKEVLAGKSSVKVTAQTHPPLDIKNLHSAVIASASQLVQDGSYRHAILDTVTRLRDEVRKKSNINLDGTALMQKVFSKENPILKFPDSDSQLGYMWLYSGAMMGLRNPRAHSLTVETNEEETLEILAFLSHLFKVLDSLPMP